MQGHALQGGFADPVFDAQSAFRSVLDAMSRPGRIAALRTAVSPPTPLFPSAGAFLCALADADTPLWLDQTLAGSADVRAWLAFHTGAPTGERGNAAFAIVADPSALPDFSAFAQGIAEYPDRSTTLLVQVPALTGGPDLIFAGPGIEGSVIFSPAGLPADFAACWAENSRRFPCGIDLVLAADAAIACLPRSARLIGGEA